MRESRNKRSGLGWKLPALSAVLVVIALTAAGAVIGQLISGPVGAAVGAIPGALAAVVAGFVPAFRDRAEGRRCAREDWDAVAEPTGPAALLRPDQEVVEFTGRECELDALRAWCASDTARSVRVVVGAGGVGKTRLALKVAQEWAADGRDWRLVSAGKREKRSRPRGRSRQSRSC